MTNSDVKELIEKAWESAQESVGTELTPHATLPGKSSKGGVHRERSARWVDALARELKRLYKGDDGNVRVFWRGRKKDLDFKLSELLFDIAVCETEKTKSMGQRKKLPFVSRCLWLVESELAEKSQSRSIVVDLSKLVMGRSEFKLFVAGVPLDTPSRSHREAKILDMCEKVAGRCSGTLYFCFIPYPSVWQELDADEYGPSVWLWREAGQPKVWIPL